MKEQSFRVCLPSFHSSFFICLFFTSLFDFLRLNVFWIFPVGRIEEINQRGQELINRGHYASDQVQRNLDDLNSSWTNLERQVTNKGGRLQEANEGQSFNRDVDDVEMWLAEVEAQLASEDLGKDSASALNLQKKHDLLEQVGIPSRLLLSYRK